MKKHLIVLGLVVLIGGSYSCKSKKDNTTDTSTTTTTTPSTTTAPVEISGDEQLRQGVTDATKDFPGVTATVDNGVVTLSGTMQRDRMQTLMQSLNTLNPKQIVNNVKYE